MPVEIAMRISGLLFLLILTINPIVLAAFGYVFGIDNYDSDAALKKIVNHQRKFRISFAFALIEHSFVTALPILLFIAFSSYNIILAIVWTIVRIGEGLIQFYNEKNYWGLLKMARKYSVASGAAKNSLGDSAHALLKMRDSRFTFGMALWAIGTLTLAIVLVTYGAAPQFIGWLGIVAGILVFFLNGIKLLKSDFKLPKVIYFTGAPFAILFEISIGVWLLFF